MPGTDQIRRGRHSHPYFIAKLLRCQDKIENEEGLPPEASRRGRPSAGQPQGEEGKGAEPVRQAKDFCLPRPAAVQAGRKIRAFRIRTGQENRTAFENFCSAAATRMGFCVSKNVSAETGAAEQKPTRSGRRTIATKTKKIRLMLEDLEKVVGGTFTLNYYWRNEYEEAGIKAVSHFIAKDEFWWNGEEIGEKAANSVVYFTALKGHAPSSLDESIPFWNENHKKKFERHRH